VQERNGSLTRVSNRLVAGVVTRVVYFGVPMLSSLREFGWKRTWLYQMNPALKSPSLGHRCQSVGESLPIILLALIMCAGCAPPSKYEVVQRLAGEGPEMLFTETVSPANPPASGWNWDKSGINLEWTQVYEDSTLRLSSPILDCALRDLDTVFVKLRLGSGKVFNFYASDGEEIDERILKRFYIPMPVPPDGGLYTYKFNVDELKENWESPEGDADRVRIALDFPGIPLSDIELESISIRTRDDFYEEHASGRNHLDEVAHQWRSTIFTHVPGGAEIVVGPRKGTRLKVGVAALGEEGLVRCRIEIADGSKVRQLFTEQIQIGSGTWKDVSVDLPTLRSDGAELRFLAESGGDTPADSVVLWGTPMLLARERDDSLPNVLLYLMDTLRADRLGVYGYPVDVSPRIDRLAADGVVFESCRSNSSWTKPSLPSILTGMYATTHNVGHANFTDRLPPAAVTLAEVLAEVGYVTASFASNPFGTKFSGLDQGFDHVYVPRAFTKGPEQSWPYSDALNDLVLPWIDEHRDSRFFVFVHTLDPHAPYEAPQVKEFTGYDNDIAFNDMQFGVLLDHLKRHGLLDNTLVVVLSDHGDSQGEHGIHGHGRSLYEPELRVPLIFWWNKRLPAVRVPGNCQLIDALPTMLDILGLETPRGCQGTSLLARIERPDSPPELRPIFSTRVNYPFDPPSDEFMGTQNFSLVLGRTKAIWNKTLGTDELFDLAADPGELNNLASAQAETSRQMHDRIIRFLDQQEEHRKRLYAGVETEDTGRTISSDDARRLRALNYL